MVSNWIDVFNAVFSGDTSVSLPSHRCNSAWYWLRFVTAHAHSKADAIALRGCRIAFQPTARADIELALRVRCEVAVRAVQCVQQFHQLVAVGQLHVGLAYALFQFRRGQRALTFRQRRVLLQQLGAPCDHRGEVEALHHLEVGVIERAVHLASRCTWR